MPEDLTTTLLFKPALSHENRQHRAAAFHGYKVLSMALDAVWADPSWGRGGEQAQQHTFICNSSMRHTTPKGFFLLCTYVTPK